jgi:hypothetical protein
MELLLILTVIGLVFTSFVTVIEAVAERRNENARRNHYLHSHFVPADHNPRVRLAYSRSRSVGGDKQEAMHLPRIGL